MLEDENLEEYFKKIIKIGITMHDNKHNLKRFNQKKTVAFVSFADGIKYSNQPHYFLLFVQKSAQLFLLHLEIF